MRKKELLNRISNHKYWKDFNGLEMETSKEHVLNAAIDELLKAQSNCASLSGMEFDSHGIINSQLKFMVHFEYKVYLMPHCRLQIDENGETVTFIRVGGGDWIKVNGTAYSLGN